MTSTLQQVADDLASHIGEMRVVMDELAGSAKELIAAFARVSTAHDIPISPADAFVAYRAQARIQRALSAYERVRKLYSIETAPTEVRKQAEDVS